MKSLGGHFFCVNVDNVSFGLVNTKHGLWRGISNCIKRLKRRLGSDKSNPKKHDWVRHAEY